MIAREVRRVQYLNARVVLAIERGDAVCAAGSCSILGQVEPQTVARFRSGWSLKAQGHQCLARMRGSALHLDAVQCRIRWVHARGCREEWTGARWRPLSDLVGSPSRPRVPY